MHEQMVQIVISHLQCTFFFKLYKIQIHKQVYTVFFFRRIFLFLLTNYKTRTLQEPMQAICFFLLLQRHSQFRCK